MANEIEKVNTMEITDIAKISGRTDDNIENLSGLEFTGIPPVWSGTRAVIMGFYAYSWRPTYPYAGGAAYLNEVGYKTLDSDADTADWGDLTEHRTINVGSGSNGTRAVVGGGFVSGATRTDTIDILTVASAGTVADHGNLSEANYYGTPDGASNGTTQLFIAGIDGAGITDRIEEMTIASTGASDNGADLRYAGYFNVAGNGDSKTLILEDSTTTGKEEISYHSFSSGADATDSGRVVTVPTSGASTAVSSTRVVYGGGTGGTAGGNTTLDTIQALTVASSADSTDEADLVTAVYSNTGTSDKTRGEFYGGIASGPLIVNDVQKVTIASLEDAADIGDLTFSTLADTYTQAGGGSRNASQTAS